jgi:hypothetical protein
MDSLDLREINWAAVFAGFGVDWAFSELVGLLVMTILLSLKGISVDANESVPPDVALALQSVGVIGAVVGGTVAGYLARRRGSLHGVLGSLVGLPLSLCLYSAALDAGGLGFIVLNLIGAGYGGRLGERLRARRKGQG